MKKVLVIAGSPRKDGNSDILAQQFAKGAEENGNHVEVVYVRDLKLNYCIGCLTCLKTGRCVQKDAMNDILPKLLEADTICLSCPVYYYDVCGQTKVFLDRCNPLFGRMKDKDFYYMVTCADATPDMIERVFDSFEGFAACFDGINNAGRVYGLNATDKGDVKTTQAFKEAYNIGKNL